MNVFSVSWQLALHHSSDDMHCEWNREANSSSASQEIPGVLWYPYVNYRIHNSLTLIPILRQCTPFQPVYSYLTSILVSTSHLCLGHTHKLLYIFGVDVTFELADCS
jgi:hypothetical protein